ncbi:putative uncharacterized protein DDB_G0286751 [Procambarus clarkii]|uniref:putative uncharacterized protein DDB_G0286751 n=1 Tax=Procambarus clarkii TaxID=6728 RepID=UPI003743A1AC
MNNIPEAQRLPFTQQLPEIYGDCVNTATTTEHTPGTESLESQISNVEGRVEVHENDGNMEEQTGNINNDSNTEKDESINEKDDGNTEKDESINEKDDGNTEKDESINEKDDGNTEKECRNEKDRTKNTDYSKIEVTKAWTDEKISMKITSAEDIEKLQADINSFRVQTDINKVKLNSASSRYTRPESQL